MPLLLLVYMMTTRKSKPKERADSAVEPFMRDFPDAHTTSQEEERRERADDLPDEKQHLCLVCKAPLRPVEDSSKKTSEARMRSSEVLYACRHGHVFSDEGLMYLHMVGF
jgi:hypothetical protein